MESGLGLMLSCKQKVAYIIMIISMNGNLNIIIQIYP